MPRGSHVVRDKALANASISRTMLATQRDDRGGYAPVRPATWIRRHQRAARVQRARPASSCVIDRSRRVRSVSCAFSGTGFSLPTGGAGRGGDVGWPIFRLRQELVAPAAQTGSARRAEWSHKLVGALRDEVKSLKWTPDTFRDLSLSPNVRMFDFPLCRFKKDSAAHREGQTVNRKKRNTLLKGSVLFRLFRLSLCHTPADNDGPWNPWTAPAALG